MLQVLHASENKPKDEREEQSIRPPSFAWNWLKIELSCQVKSDATF